MSGADIIKVLSMSMCARGRDSPRRLSLLIKTIADSWEALKTVSLFCLAAIASIVDSGEEQTMESWLHHIGENGVRAVDGLKTLREHDMRQKSRPLHVSGQVWQNTSSG